MDLEKTNNFEKAVLTYIQTAPKNESIFTGSDITDDLIKNHSYCLLIEGEKPLIVINKCKWSLFSGKPTGMVITNKGIHYQVLKNSFFTSLTALFTKPITGFQSIETIYHFQIGEHDTCYGTAYIGHVLMINEQKLGLLRMGSKVFLDEEMISFINNLSQKLFEVSLLKKEPVEYAWQ